MRLTPLPFALAAALLFAAGAAAAVVSGAAAPEFTITDTAGKAVQLADYKGKYVVLEWTNPDARSCGSTTPAATCRRCRRNGAPRTSCGSRSTRPSEPLRIQDARAR